MKESAILFQSKVLTLDPVLASIIGLNEAIILSQMNYWCVMNERQNQGKYDDYYWVKSSIALWQERDFIFFSTDTIRRAITKLESMELIISMTPKEQGINRTKWYRINHEKLKEIEDEYQAIKYKKITTKEDQEDEIDQEPIEDEIEAKNEDETPESVENTEDLPLGQNAQMHYDKMHKCISANCTNALGQNAQMYYYKKINNKQINNTHTLGAKPQITKTDLDEIQTRWNKIFEQSNISTIKKLTSQRKQKLKARLQEFSKDEIFEAMDKIKDSSFCQGIGGKGWTATFDWMIFNDNNLTKILEGQYDDKKPKQTQADRELDEMFKNIGVRF